MKLVVAFCQLHPKTAQAALAELKADAQIVWADTSGSDTAYFEAIERHWAEGQTFVLLEQDKLPVPGALRALHDCPASWCTYPVPMAHNGQPCDFVSLSCTKFSAELMAAVPDLMDRVAKLNMGRGPKHWDRLDMSMALECTKALGRMRRPPYECHWHPAGMVGHEHIPLGVHA